MAGMRVPARWPLCR